MTVLPDTNQTVPEPTVVVLSVTDVLVVVTVAVSFVPGFRSRSVTSFPSITNLLDSGGVKYLISPFDILTTRLLPSTTTTVPVKVSAVTADAPGTLSVVDRGICCAAAVNARMVTKPIAMHNPVGLLRK